MSSSLRRRRAIQLLWILACLFGATAPAAGSAAPTLEEFDGTWLRVNRESDDEAREAALLRATDSMSFLIRGSTRLFMRRSIHNELLGGAADYTSSYARER